MTQLTRFYITRPLAAWLCFSTLFAKNITRQHDKVECSGFKWMIWIQILIGFKYKLIAIDPTFWYHVIIGTNHGRCVLGTSNPDCIVSPAVLSRGFRPWLNSQTTANIWQKTFRHSVTYFNETSFELKNYPIANIHLKMRYATCRTIK